MHDRAVFRIVLQGGDGRVYRSVPGITPYKLVVDASMATVAAAWTVWLRTAEVLVLKSRPRCRWP